MLRRVFWIIICCGSLGAVAAAVVSIERNGRLQNSETLVPRAARNDRVIGLTDTTTNAVSNRPYWGSDASGKGGLDIVWGPACVRSQSFNYRSGGMSLGFEVLKNCYVYPIVTKMYRRHTYHWRELDAAGKTLVRNPNGTVREYTATVDQPSVYSMNWAGPFSRNTPLRGEISGSLIPPAARNRGVFGLTDEVTNVTTRAPLRGSGGRRNGLDIVWGPAAPLAQSVGKRSDTSYLPFTIARDRYAYPILVTTFIRHTYRWQQRDTTGSGASHGVTGTARQYTAAVDRYAGSAIGWAGPFSRSAPLPLER